jgi:hypothetical protein
MGVKLGSFFEGYNSRIDADSLSSSSAKSNIGGTIPSLPHTCTWHSA